MIWGESWLQVGLGHHTRKLNRRSVLQRCLTTSCCSPFRQFRSFCNVNCKTPNVVYLLDCHVSGSQYVGESVQLFNKWMNGHRSDLTKKTHLPVSQHFLSPGHSLDDFGRSKIYIIDHNPSWKENQRQKREGFWIRELRTLHPEA